jgi:hypothetical protein
VQLLVHGLLVVKVGATIPFHAAARQQGELGQKADEEHDQARRLGAAAAATWWPDGQMLPARSSLANSELVVVLPPRSPPLELPLPPEKTSGPDPERQCSGYLGGLFLLSETISPEWLLPLPAPQPPPFTTEEEDGVARIRSSASMAGDLADPRVGVGSEGESKIKRKITD